MKVKRWITLFLAVCLLTTTAACGAEGGTNEGGGGEQNHTQVVDTERVVDKNKTIVYGMAGSPNETYNFYRSTGTRTMITIDSIFDKLVFIDSHGEICPRAAKSWEWSDDSRTLTLYLNENYWHDGEPVTAEDWVWTIQILCNQELQDDNCLSKICAYLEGCDPADGSPIEGQEVGVEYIDDLTFSITLNDVYNTTSFLQTILSYFVVLPKHCFTNEDGTVKTPIQVMNESPEYWSKPIGSGPGKIVEDSLDSYTKLEAWDKYYGYGEDGPQFKYLVYQYVSDANQFGSKIVAGDLDMCYPGLTNEDVEYYSGNSDIQLYESATVITQYDINFDCSRVPKYIRLAMNYAIDKQFILDSMCGGRGEVGGGSLVMPHYKYYVPNLGTDQDVELAKEYFNTAVENGSWDPNDTLTMNVSSDLYESVANVVASYCEDIGLHVEVVRRDSITTIQQNMFWASTEGYDCVLWSFAPTIDPCKVGTFLQYDTCVDGNFFARWGINEEDKEDSLAYQEVYREFTKAFSEEDQQYYAEEMQKYENEGCPAISLVNIKEVYACSPYVGSTVNELGVPDVTGVNYYNQDIWNWVGYAK